MADKKLDTKNTNHDFSALLMLMKRIHIKGLHLFILTILLILSSASSLLYPILTQQFIDDSQQNEIFSWPYLLLLALILLLGACLSSINYYIMGKIGNRWAKQLRQDISKHLYLAPIHFFNNTLSGDPASRLVNDVDKIKSLITLHINSVIESSLVMIFSIIVLFLLDLKMTLILCASVLIGFLVILPIAKGMSLIAKKLQQEKSSIVSSLAERFAMIRLIKTHNAEMQELRKQQARNEKLFRLDMKEIVRHALMSPLISLSLTGGMIVILGYGAISVNSGTMTIGTLVAFILYLFNIVTPLIGLSMFLVELNTAAGASHKLVDYLAIQPTDKNAGEPTTIHGKSIRLENVTVRYDDKLALDQVDLNIPWGKTTALVGHSGSGKSTLLSLLTRVLEPSEGKLYLGNDTITDLQLAHWQMEIGYVAQDAPALSIPLRENLCYGLNQIPEDKQIWQALKDAALDDYVQNLSQQLDTPIGERGETLSGGQRQRMAIARAFLRNPKLLLFDEATASLDSITETKIKDALQKLTHGITCVISAHRLSTIVHADQIVLMDEGRIICCGTHQQLLKESTLYYELVKKQITDKE